MTNVRFNGSASFFAYTTDFITWIELTPNRVESGFAYIDIPTSAVCTASWRGTGQGVGFDVPLDQRDDAIHYYRWRHRSHRTNQLGATGKFSSATDDTATVTDVTGRWVGDNGKGEQFYMEPTVPQTDQVSEMFCNLQTGTLNVQSLSPSDPGFTDATSKDSSIKFSVIN